MGNECYEQAGNISGISIDVQVKKIDKLKYTQASIPQNDHQISDYLKSKHMQGQKVYKDQQANVYYIGKWNQKIQPEGRGVIYKPNKFIYLGNFNGINLDGNAQVLSLTNNFLFKGQVKNGSAEGKGKLHNPKECYVIEAQWENSRPIKGVIQHQKKGAKIISQDFSSNEAKIIYNDKKIYEGQVSPKYFPNGKGKLTFPNEDSYDGEWVEGMMEGQGTFISYFDDKDRSIFEKYTGSFKQSKREGKGIMIFKNKNYYKGNWQRGKMDGQGAIYDSKDNLIKKGIWKNGEYIKSTFPNQ